MEDEEIVGLLDRAFITDRHFFYCECGNPTPREGEPWCHCVDPIAVSTPNDYEEDEEAWKSLDDLENFGGKHSPIAPAPGPEQEEQEEQEEVVQEDAKVEEVEKAEEIPDKIAGLAEMDD